MPPKGIYSKIWWTALLLAACLAAFLAGVTFLNPSSVGNPDFVSNTNLWAAVWAANFLLVLVLTFILARDLVKLYFEYQARRPGSRIKSKLTATFILFSLFPALIMAFLAFGLINRNLQLWFTSPSEQLLGSSEQIVARYYRLAEESLHRSLQRIAGDPRGRGEPDEGQLAEWARREGVAALAWLDTSGGRLVHGPEWIEAGEPAVSLGERGAAGEPFFLRRRLFERQQADTDLLVAGLPVAGPEGRPAGILLGQSVLPESVQFHALQVEEARRKFEQLEAGVQQAETSYFAILVLSTLTVVFGFVWLANYIAKRITVPLEALAEGAEQLAGGHLEYRVDVTAVDELGILVDSFNRMAGELEENRRQLEKANRELISINQQLDQRRRYTETILQNIATGVISLDESDQVRTVNEAALHILQRGRDESVGQPLERVVGEELRRELNEMKRLAALYGSSRRDLSFRRGEQQRFIAATVTVNPLPSQGDLEYLVVLDDLTELIRAEKFAAWQEVARRLAHEIKNPLTPIQLSTDRIRRRFARLAPEPDGPTREFQQVLEQGLRIIAAESAMLESLVDEFSRFARLPISRPVQTDLHALLEQTLTHYDGALRPIRVESDFDPELRTVRLDPEQMRRVFANLIDNAVDALTDHPNGPTLEIRTRLHPSRRSVSVEFADNGSGISPEDYDKLFLPYFSTKKKGTGLGLAIVQQIVSEHQGHIRAEPNHPRGMRFTLELPA